MTKHLALPFLVLALALSGCVGGGDGNGNKDKKDTGTTDSAGTLDNDPAGDTGELKGSVTGKITDTAAVALEGVMVLACDDDSCITAKTDANGLYTIGLPLGWRKMQLMGTAKGKMNMLYYQNVEGTEPTEVSRDLVLVGMPEGAQPLPKEGGGTAVLADGALTITSADGVAVYPIGAVEEVYAAKAAASQLPPYDQDDPWLGKEEETIAFHINPLPVLVSEEGQNFEFSVTGGSGAYVTYYVNAHYGTLHEAGQVSADADGNITGTVPELTTLILVPAD